MIPSSRLLKTTYTDCIRRRRRLKIFSQFLLLGLFKPPPPLKREKSCGAPSSSTFHITDDHDDAIRCLSELYCVCVESVCLFVFAIRMEEEAKKRRPWLQRESCSMHIRTLVNWTHKRHRYTHIEREKKGSQVEHHGLNICIIIIKSKVWLSLSFSPLFCQEKERKKTLLNKAWEFHNKYTLGGGKLNPQNFFCLPRQFGEREKERDFFASLPRWLCRERGWKRRFALIKLRGGRRGRERKKPSRLSASIFTSPRKLQCKWLELLLLLFFLLFSSHFFLSLFLSLHLVRYICDKNFISLFLPC